jgi:hypothetical protein
MKLSALKRHLVSLLNHQQFADADKLLEENRIHSEIALLLTAVIRGASRNRLDILRWCKTHHRHVRWSAGLTYACRHGHLVAAQFCTSQDPLCASDHQFLSAVTSGVLPVVEHLATHLRGQGARCQVPQKAVWLACHHGFDHILQYLLVHCNIHIYGSCLQQCRKASTIRLIMTHRPDTLDHIAVHQWYYIGLEIGPECLLPVLEWCDWGHACSDMCEFLLRGVLDRGLAPIDQSLFFIICNECLDNGVDVTKTLFRALWNMWRVKDATLANIVFYLCERQLCFTKSHPYHLVGGEPAEVIRLLNVGVLPEGLQDMLGCGLRDSLKRKKRKLAHMLRCLRGYACRNVMAYITNLYITYE